MAKRWERKKDPVQVPKEEVSGTNIFIKRKTEDGKEVNIDMELCNLFAVNSLDSLYAFEDEVENFDFVASVFSLYSECIHVLASAGWTPEELKTQVDEHYHCWDED